MVTNALFQDNGVVANASVADPAPVAPAPVPGPVTGSAPSAAPAQPPAAAQEPPPPAVLSGGTVGPQATILTSVDDLVRALHPPMTVAPAPLPRLPAVPYQLTVLETAEHLSGHAAFIEQNHQHLGATPEARRDAWVRGQGYLHFLPHGSQCVPRTLIESTLREVSALGDQPRTLWQCYSSAVLQTYVAGAWGQAGRRIHDDLATLTLAGSNHLLLVQQFRLLCNLLVTIGEPIDDATMRSMLLRKLPPSIQQEIRGRYSPNRPPPTLEEVIQQAMIHAPVHEPALLAAMVPGAPTDVVAALGNASFQAAPGYRQGRRQGPGAPPRPPARSPTTSAPWPCTATSSRTSWTS